MLGYVLATTYETYNIVWFIFSDSLCLICHSPSYSASLLKGLRSFEYYLLAMSTLQEAHTLCVVEHNLEPF